MSKVIDRLKRRTARAVKVGEDEFHLRSMTSNEVRDADSITNPNEKADFVLGTALVEPDGSRVFQRLESESADQFAKRMQSELGDVEEATKIELLTALTGASKVPPVEAIAKN